MTRVPSTPEEVRAANLFHSYRIGWLAGVQIRAMDPKFTSHDNAEIVAAYQLGYHDGGVARREALKRAEAVYGYKQNILRLCEVVHVMGPRRISDRVLELTITGYLMPAEANGKPVLVGMPGTDDLFVMVFSTKSKLDAMMSAFDLSYARIMVIEDGDEFFASIDEENARRGPSIWKLRVAVDAYRTDDGRARFVEAFEAVD